jgi:hypothetical protein
MANDASRASIRMHYTIMGVIVAWIVGLGFYVFY